MLKFFRIKSPTRLVVGLFMTVFLAVACFNVVSQVNTYRKLKQDEARILADIQNEKDKAEELKIQKEYLSSSEYIEEVARNQLGLIKPDEILFVRN